MATKPSALTHANVPQKAAPNKRFMQVILALAQPPLSMLERQHIRSMAPVSTGTREVATYTHTYLVSTRSGSYTVCVDAVEGNLSCTCPDFKFRFEYLLHKAGLARIQFSNGKPPTSGHTLGVCKHLNAVIHRLRNEGNT